MVDEALSTKIDQSTKMKSFSIQMLWNSDSFLKYWMKNYNWFLEQQNTKAANQKYFKGTLINWTTVMYCTNWSLSLSCQVLVLFSRINCPYAGVTLQLPSGSDDSEKSPKVFHEITASCESLHFEEMLLSSSLILKLAGPNRWFRWHIWSLCS